MTSVVEAPAMAVAVTGLGVVSPAGSDIDTFWTAMLDGKSRARRLDWLETPRPIVDFACEVSGFDAATRLGAKVVRRTDPFTQFALAAAAEAIDDAALSDVDVNRAAVVVGNGGGGARTGLDQYRRAVEDGLDLVNPLLVPMAMSSAAAAQIGIRTGWHGPNYTVNTACASGAHAIGEGLRLLRDNSADVVVAGGTEAGITPLALQAFARAQALSTRCDDPARASRPFDRERDGFVMGEGAAFCVLEPLEAARARGARIHAVLLGYGRNTDGFHLVMPSPEGRYAAECMRLALANAGIEPDAVSHVHAHGTSTVLNDVAESKAINDVFGHGRPTVTSSKGVVGHLVGAAGALSFVVAALTAREALVPPTANHEELDEEIDLDVVAGEPRVHDGGAILVNSFGFGGHNASLVVRPHVAEGAG